MMKSIPSARFAERALGRAPVTARVLRFAGVVSTVLAGCSSSSDDPGTSPGGATGAGATGGSSPGGSAGAFGSGGMAGAGGVGGGGAGGGTGVGGTGVGGGSTFPPVTDFAAPGPFQTTRAAEAECTINRPTTLGEQGRKHPIIIWGNGTGASPATYQAVFAHWASHGFIVAAANTSNSGSGTEMIACLDWVIQQNGASGSPYFGNVDPGHVGASGHSQGGAGTLMAGRDARVTVTAPLQPYVAFPLGGFQSTSIGAQKGAMFLQSGSADTIATPSANQQRIYDTTNVPVFWGTLQGATHTGTAIGSIGGYRGPSTAWFRLHLMGDESARSLFYGASCGLCSDATWRVQKKGIE
jgi:hypothetical protein